MIRISSKASVAIMVILMTMTAQTYGQELSTFFYKGKCGKANVESIVFRAVKKAFAEDPTLPAALLRMYFHDCFVRGCDASILLDGSDTEKMSGSNGSVRRYDLIDTIKEELEAACPDVVSCADIIALATRDITFFATGRWYRAEGGRRDSTISSEQEASSTLPGPTISVDDGLQLFMDKGVGIDAADFVALLGCHTVGIANCGNFADRMFNFNGNSGTSDPNMNSTLRQQLSRTCSSGGAGFANLDQFPGSADTVDNGFFKAVLMRKGVLQVDNDLGLDSTTRGIVTKFATDHTAFRTTLTRALIKMGRMGVLTGNQGQIRRNCRRRN